jgi:hypothetical protein
MEVLFRVIWATTTTTTTTMRMTTMMMQLVRKPADGRKSKKLSEGVWMKGEQVSVCVCVYVYVRA